MHKFQQIISISFTGQRHSELRRNKENPRPDPYLATGRHVYDGELTSCACFLLFSITSIVKELYFMYLQQHTPIFHPQISFWVS